MDRSGRNSARWSAVLGGPKYPSKPWMGLLFALSLLSVVYTSLGLACLAWDTGASYPIDLRLRWIEGRFVWHGINPQDAGHPDPIVAIKHGKMTNLGGGYPPWAYSLGLILAPPMPWWLVRWYSVTVNAGALAIISWWAYDKLSYYGRTWGLVSVTSTLAIFPATICLSYGQYAVIISGCLAAVDFLLDRRSLWSDVIAGCALGVACVKPQLGGVFALAVLMEGRLICAATCVALVVASAGMTGLLVAADPVTMFQRSVEEASAYTFLSHNPLVHSLESRLGFRTATATLSFAGLLACLSSLFILRNSERPVRWGVCAVITMYWGYRKHYDVPLMMFALVALLRVALDHRDIARYVAYIALGLTLWFPLRDEQWNAPVIQWVDLVVWGAAALVLLRNGDVGRRVEPASKPVAAGGAT